MSSLSKKCPHFHGVKLTRLKTGSHKDSCTRVHTHTQHRLSDKPANKLVFHHLMWKYDSYCVFSARMRNINTRLFFISFKWLSYWQEMETEWSTEFKSKQTSYQIHIWKVDLNLIKRFWTSSLILDQMRRATRTHELKHRNVLSVHETTASSRLWAWFSLCEVTSAPLDLRQTPPVHLLHSHLSYEGDKGANPWFLRRRRRKRRRRRRRRTELSGRNFLVYL